MCDLSITLIILFFFFFSSRRRHTRSLCDWSSDVCSSDLREADEGQDRLMTEMPTQSLISESYRGLRSSINFAAVDEPIKSLLVSSSNKGEGKSLTSVNLAIAMALDRRRVILVDADLRRPNIHRLLRVEQSPGLSDLLVDQVPLEDALQETAVEGLQVIASRPRPPHPAELLNSGRK